MPHSDPGTTDEHESQTDSLAGLLKHTSIYAIAPIFQRALSVVLIAVYTTALEPSEYGLLTLMDLFLALFPILVGTSLIAGLSRHYFVQESSEERSAVISGTAIALVACSAAGALLAYYFRAPLAAAVFRSTGRGVSSELVDYLTISIAYMPFALLCRTGFEALQIEKRSKLVVKITLAKTLLEASLKLIFLLIFEWGVMGFLFAVLIGEAVAGVGFGAFILRRHGARITRKTMLPLARYALPLVPVGIFQLGLHQADTLMIEKMGPSSVIGIGEDGVELTLARQWLGIYGIGYKLPFLFHTAVMASFMRIWRPNLFALKEDATRGGHVQRVGSLVSIAIIGLYAQVSLFGREAVRLLGRKEALHAADAVVPWIAIGYVVYAFYGLSQAALMSAFATRSLAVINAFALAVNLALNYVWIAEYGYLGAAAATTVSFAFLAAVSATVSTRRGIAPFYASTILRGLCVLVAAVILGRYIDLQTEAWSLTGFAAKGAVSLLLVALLIAALPAADRARVVGAVRDKLQ